MSLFIEVGSIEKGCKVIVNLEEVIEIAPLSAGGCALFFADAAAVGGKSAMKVTDSYEQFRQFAVEPVSSDMIEKKIKGLKPNLPIEMEIPKL